MLFEVLEPRVLFSATLSGDYNNDHVVDFGDLALIAQQFSHLYDFGDLLKVAQQFNWHEYNGQTATVNGVFNVWQANPGDFGDTWTAAPATLYSFGGPLMTTVHQGQLADCYLQVVFASETKFPTLITNMISWDGQGWLTKWHDYAGREIDVHSSNEFSVGLQPQTGELWADVLEKAYAWMRFGGIGATSPNTMHSLDYGYEGDVLSSMGIANKFILFPTLQSMTSIIDANLAENKTVYLNTTVSAPTMVQNHAYSILKKNADGTYLTYNPWGFFDTRTAADLYQNGVRYLVIGN